MSKKDDNAATAYEAVGYNTVLKARPGGFPAQLNRQLILKTQRMTFWSMTSSLEDTPTLGLYHPDVAVLRQTSCLEYGARLRFGWLIKKPTTFMLLLIGWDGLSKSLQPSLFVVEVG